MYTPDRFKIKDPQHIIEFIQHQPFGTLISQDLQATHLPFMVENTASHSNTISGTKLYSHFAKANTHWEHVENQDILIVFSGPHAYISPTWYDSSPEVPTWNYTSVHIKGRCAILPSEKTEWLLNQSLAYFEPALIENREIVTEDFQNTLAQAIVPIQIEITEAIGKLKLGQHKPEPAQKNVFKHLKHSQNLAAQQLAQFMEKFAIGTGTEKR